MTQATVYDDEEEKKKPFLGWISLGNHVFGTRTWQLITGKQLDRLEHIPLL